MVSVGLRGSNAELAVGRRMSRAVFIHMEVTNHKRGLNAFGKGVQVSGIKMFLSFFFFHLKFYQLRFSPETTNLANVKVI